MITFRCCVQAMTAVLCVLCHQHLVVASESTGESQELPIDPTALSWSAGYGLSLPSLMASDEVADAPPVLQLPDAIAADIFGPMYEPRAEQIREQAPGSFEGGVTMTYERIRLQADSLLFWQRPLLAGDETAWPLRVLLLPGENGPEADRVHIDTRYSSLPTMNFTGLLRPRRVVIDRAPYAGESSEPVIFRVLLQDVGHFRGEVRVPNRGWRTVTGYAQHMLIQMHARRLPDGRLSEPMVQAFHLFGGAAQDQEQEAQLTAWGDPAPLSLASSRIGLTFRADGSLERFVAGRDARMFWFDPDHPVPQRDAYDIMRDPQQEAAQQQRRLQSDLGSH